MKKGYRKRKKEERYCNFKKEIMGVHKENKTAEELERSEYRGGYGLRTDIQTPVSCCQSPGPTVAAKY